MPRGVYKRKKVGRPKGSRNKKFSMAGLTNYNPTDDLKLTEIHTKKWAVPTEPASFISRLEAATIKYEQAINEAISILKGQ